MDLQPVLEGERLIVRPLRPEDWGALYAVASDKAIWALHPAHDRWQEPVFRAFFDEALASGGAFAIVERDSGEIVGSSRYDLSQVDAPDEIEIGWSFLARRCWGQGTNAEFKRLMLAHALKHYRRAIFQVGEDNVISRKAMENIGGQLVPGRTRTFARGGQDVVHVIYAIDRESFDRGPLAR